MTPFVRHTPAEPESALSGVTATRFSEILQGIGATGVQTEAGRIASRLLGHCLTLARAYSHTDAGKVWLAASAERALGFGFVYRLAIDDGPLIGQCVDAILLASDDPTQRRAALAEMTPEFFAAIKYLAWEWQEARDELLPRIIIALNGYIHNGCVRAIH